MQRGERRKDSVVQLSATCVLMLVSRRGPTADRGGVYCMLHPASAIPCCTASGCLLRQGGSFGFLWCELVVLPCVQPRERGESLSVLFGHAVFEPACHNLCAGQMECVECVACYTKRPEPGSPLVETTAAAGPSPQTEEAPSHALARFMLSDNQWECSVCMVPNEVRDPLLSAMT